MHSYASPRPWKREGRRRMILVEEAVALAVEEEEGMAVDQDEAEAVLHSRCNILHRSSRHSLLSLTKRPSRLKYMIPCRLELLQELKDATRDILFAS
jgi:hypothetical protein